MISSLCNLCNQKHKKKLVKLPMSKFIVGDGSKMLNAKKNYYFCHNTNFFVTNANISWKKNINKIYKKYKLNNEGVFKGNFTRENTIIQLIRKSNINVDNILEIGPGLGVLLKRLNSLKEVKTLDVLETNNNLLRVFRKNNKFKKLYLNFGEIKKKYNLIILSHSFFHIIRLNKFVKQLYNLLESNGSILIVTPDPLNFHILPYVYEVYSFSNKRNIINYFQKFNLYLKKDFHSILKNEIVILFSIKKKNKKIKPDNKFFKNHKLTQKKFYVLHKNLKKHKALIIHGAGLHGKFFYFTLKNKVFKIYDDNFNVNLKSNEKLINIKPKKIIKTYNFSLK